MILLRVPARNSSRSTEAGGAIDESLESHADSSIGCRACMQCIGPDDRILTHLMRDVREWLN